MGSDSRLQHAVGWLSCDIRGVLTQVPALGNPIAVEQEKLWPLGWCICKVSWVVGKPCIDHAMWHCFSMLVGILNENHTLAQILVAFFFFGDEISLGVHH